jgi:hypothetical protein
MLSSGSKPKRITCSVLRNLCRFINNNEVNRRKSTNERARPLLFIRLGASRPINFCIKAF